MVLNGYQWLLAAALSAFAAFSSGIAPSAHTGTLISPPSSLPLSSHLAAPHPFYIAVTEVTHNAKDADLEISCKLFADDLEQVIEKDYKTQLDISKPSDKAAFDKYIPDYVRHHLSLVVDGKPVPLSYIGFEKDKESAFCYFQVDKVSTPKKIDAVNSLLHDFTDQQINIMHVTVGGKRQSTKLDYPNQKAAFTF